LTPIPLSELFPYLNKFIVLKTMILKFKLKMSASYEKNMGELKNNLERLSKSCKRAVGVISI